MRGWVAAKWGMKNHLCAAGLLELIAIGSVGLAQAATTFTYQGKLPASGEGVSRNADLRVRLFDSPDGGTQVGPELQHSAVARDVFSVNMDFGAIQGREPARAKSEMEAMRAKSAEIEARMLKARCGGIALRRD